MFGECLSSRYWGRLSDKRGRKTIFLAGLAGTALALLCFGFAATAPVAVAWRLLAGLLNGNVVVFQLLLVELVQCPTDLGTASAMAQVCWSAGCCIGAWVGGRSSDPVRAWPAWFVPGSVWDHHPYLLPNVVCAVILLLELMIGARWLCEPEAKSRCAKEIIADPCSAYAARRYVVISAIMALYVCIVGPTSPSPLTTDISHLMATEQLLLRLFSKPKLIPPLKPSMWFTGGFGYSTKHVGEILAVQNAMQFVLGIVVVCLSRLYSLSQHRWSVLQVVPFVFATLYAVDPLLLLVPRRWRETLIYANTLVRYPTQHVSHAAIAVMLKQIAPVKDAGSFYGSTQSLTTGCRCFGSFISGPLQALGTACGTLLLPWWANALIAAVCLIPLRQAMNKDVVEFNEEEALNLSPKETTPLLAYYNSRECRGGGGVLSQRTDPQLRRVSAC